VESNERETVERASRGDEQALSDLLARHLPMLEAYFRLKTGPALLAHESVSDLVQSVCLDVLSELGGFEYRGEAEFRAWLVKHARSKLSERWRYWQRAKRAQDRVRFASDRSSGASLEELLACFLTPSRNAIGKEELHRLETALERLPEEMREAILLRRIVSLPYTEIAKILGKNEGAVRNLVYRGTARVALQLDPSPPEEERSPPPDSGS